MPAVRSESSCSFPTPSTVQKDAVTLYDTTYNVCLLKHAARSRNKCADSSPWCLYRCESTCFLLFVVEMLCKRKRCAVRKV
jgi:hypothetical protein